MKNSHHNHRHTLEDDPVWKLLGHASKPPEGPRFVDDVVRLAKLEGGPALPWWRRWLASPVPAAAFAGAAAAVLIGLFALRPAADAPPDAGAGLAAAPPAVEVDRLDHIQEVLESELLLVAVDHLDEFSDDELVALIGF